MSKLNRNPGYNLSDYYPQAVEIVLRTRTPTTTSLAKELGISTTVTAKLLDKMAQQGIIKWNESNGRRVMV